MTCECDQQKVFLYSAYHGHLTSVMEISPYKFNLPGGDAKPDFVHVASIFILFFYFFRVKRVII